MRSSQGALETQQTQMMHSCIPQGCTQPGCKLGDAHKAGEGTQTRHDASYADGWITEIPSAAGHSQPVASGTNEHVHCTALKEINCGHCNERKMSGVITKL